MEYLIILGITIIIAITIIIVIVKIMFYVRFFQMSKNIEEIYNNQDAIIRLLIEIKNKKDYVHKDE